MQFHLFFTALGVYVIASGHLGRGASKAVFADFFWTARALIFTVLDLGRFESV